MDENIKQQGMVNECLSLLSNETTAKLLSKYFDTTISPHDILSHKEHASDWIPIREAITTLDWSNPKAVAKFTVLDGLRGMMLRPGRTSPYATLQGVHTMLEVDQQEKNSDVASTYNVIEEVKCAVLEETAEVPEIRARIANRLDGVIHRCLEARL